MAAKDQNHFVRHFGLQLVEHCVRWAVLWQTEIVAFRPTYYRK